MTLHLRIADEAMDPATELGLAPAPVEPLANFHLELARAGRSHPPLQLGDVVIDLALGRRGTIRGLGMTSPMTGKPMQVSVEFPGQGLESMVAARVARVHLVAADARFVLCRIPGTKHALVRDADGNARWVDIAAPPSRPYAAVV